MIITPNSNGSFSAFQMVHNRPVMADMPSRVEAMEECLLLVQANHAGYTIGQMRARRDYLETGDLNNRYPVGTIEWTAYNDESEEISKREGVLCRA